MIELRPYQEECVRLVLEAFEKDRSGFEFLVLATGAGKTIIFSHIGHKLNKKYGMNILIVAHRDELLSQAADKYHMIDPTAIIGKVGSGVHEYGGQVTVASVATICRPEHLKKLQEIGYGLVVIDEAHHMASRSYQEVLKVLPNAFKLGVTATPDRLDKKDITNGKKPLYQAGIIDLVEQGYLCNFKAVAIQTHISLDNVKSSMGDFNEGELNDAVNTPARNNLIVQKYQEHVDGKRAVAFCVTVAHAEALAQTFNEAEIPAAIIEGNTPLDKRKQIYHDFETGKIKILTNVMVLTEGWDSPRCEVAIMARPTQSRSLYVQQFGRILRKSPGKQHATLIDVTDNCLNHRLSPQNLRKAIVKHINDQETLLEALEREKLESEEREIQVRKLKEKRLKDIHIDLFEKLEWKELPNGVYLLEIGPEKHKIALTPSTNQPDSYYVQLKRAPYNGPHDKAQKLIDSPLPIDWAQQEAEKAARKIMSEPRGISLVDPSSPWRNKPISESQIKMMKRKKITFNLEMKRGEASDLIDKHKAEIEKRKAAKQARKDAKAIEA